MELIPGTSEITKYDGSAQASHNSGEDDKCPKKILVHEAETARVVAKLNDKAPGIHFTNWSDSSPCWFTSGIGGVMKLPISKNVEPISAIPYCLQSAASTGFHYGGILLAQRQHQNLRPQQDYTFSSNTNNYDSLMPSHSFTTSGPNCWSSFNTAPATLIKRNLNNCPAIKTIYGNAPSSTGFYCFNESGGTETESKKKVANADGATMISYRKGGPCRASSYDMQGFGKISKITDFTPQMVKTGSTPLRKSARGMRCNSMNNKSKIGGAPSKRQRNRKPPLLTNPNKKSLDSSEFDADHEDLLVAANSVNNARARACSDPFWKKTDGFFAPVAVSNLPLLKRKLNPIEELNQTAPLVSSDGVVTEGFSMSKIGKVDQGSVISTDGGPKAIKKSNVAPSLFQKILSAIIDEDEGQESHESNEVHKAGVKSEVQSGAKLLRQKYFLMDGLSGSACASVITTSQNDTLITFCNDDLCQADDKLAGSGPGSSDPADDGGSSKFHNDEPRKAEDGMSISNAEVLFGNDLDYQNAIHSTEVDRLNWEYQALSLDEKISLELQSIGLSYGEMPLGCGREVGIDEEIKGLQIKLQEQASKVNKMLGRIDAAVQCAQVLERRTIEESAMDQLVQIAYKRIKVRRPRNASKQVALAFARRTLARCKQFEESGRSCFSDPSLQDIIFKRPPVKKDVEPAEGLKRKRETRKNTKHKDSALGPVPGAIPKRARRSDKLQKGSTRFQQTLIKSPKPPPGFVISKKQLPNQISGSNLKAKEALTITQPHIGVSNAEQPLPRPCSPSASYDRTVEKGKMKFLNDIVSPASSEVNLTRQIGGIHSETIAKIRDKHEVAPASTYGNVDKPKATSKRKRTLSRFGMLELAKTSQSSVAKPGDHSNKNSKEPEAPLIAPQPSTGSDHQDKILAEMAKFRAPYLREDLGTLLDHDDLVEVDSEGLDVPLDSLFDINLFM